MFNFCLGGGKINRPGQLAPRGEDNQGGFMISCDTLLSCCPWDKINWDTGWMDQWMLSKASSIKKAVTHANC